MTLSCFLHAHFSRWTPSQRSAQLTPHYCLHVYTYVCEPEELCTPAAMGRSLRGDSIASPLFQVPPVPSSLYISRKEEKLARGRTRFPSKPAEMFGSFTLRSAGEQRMLSLRQRSDMWSRGFCGWPAWFNRPLDTEILHLSLSETCCHFLSLWLTPLLFIFFFFQRLYISLFSIFLFSFFFFLHSVHRFSIFLISFLF